MRSIRCNIVALLALCFICSYAFAQQHSLDYEELVPNSQIDVLAKDARWLALLHAKPKSPYNRQVESYIDDASFFLTDIEKLDPKLELLATVEHFVKQPKSQCEYTGRRFWLAEVLPEFSAALPLVECKKYQDWLNAIDAKSVTLVFAASYLNSPSSMYGHTLLRVDSRAKNKNVAYLSQALNFAAKVEQQDNGFMYSLKGLAGGYPGLFSMLPYHQKLKEYSRLENRDIWEYRLNLTEHEIQRMLSHVWELEHVQFDYYFFDENCSYRLLELFEVARPGIELTENFGFYAIPVDTVRVVQNAGLIDSASVRPSAQRALSFQIEKLDKAERKQVAALVSQQKSPEILLAHPVNRVGEMATVANDYWRYRYQSVPREERSVDKQLELLRLINQYPASQHNNTEITEGLLRPDKGHNTELFSVNIGEYDKALYTQLEWRISYHDLLDDGRGYPQGVSLNMGRLQLRVNEQGNSRLQRFDLIEITSLAPRDEFFKPVSWHVNAGWERVFTKSNPLVSHVSGGGGLTRTIAGSVNAFAFANARIEYGDDLAQHFDTGLGLSLGFYAGERNKLMLSLEQWKLTAAGNERYTSELSYNWSLGINHAIRLNWQHDWFDSQEVNNVSLGYRYYF